MDGTKVGLYLRLSREDETREAQSQSILNQREFLLKYAREHGFTVVDIYADDGFSGLDFERPAFKRMLHDIETGKIQTVITKDLSRLGRDYIQTGHYLERYFPQRNVRYIAVNDRIDTGEQDAGTNELTPFLSIINDMYAKDISKKVRAALGVKKENGQFIGSIPPFGYKKDPADKNRLLVDPEAAPVVKKIYDAYLQTGSIAGVAKILAQGQIPPPSHYRKGSGDGESIGVWSHGTLKRILTNPTYAGHLTQNRSRKVNHKLKKRIALPRETWMVVPNTHEAIVSQGQFDCIQQMLQVRSYLPQNRRGAAGHLLTGLAFCADCGAPMTFVKESQTRTYLVCRTSRNAGHTKVCTSHCIREDYVEKMIQKALRQLADRGLDLEMLVNRMKRAVTEQSGRQLAKDEQKLQFSGEVLANLYRDKVKGIFSQEQFIEIGRVLEQEQEQLKAQITYFKKIARKQENDAAIREKVCRFLRFEPLERPVLLALVKKVIVRRDKKIEVHFRFGQPQ